MRFEKPIDRWASTHDSELPKYRPRLFSMAGEGPVSEFFLDENRHLVLRQAEDMCVGVMNGVCGGGGGIVNTRICLWV